MTDEQFNAYFRTVADHLESLATSLQTVEELQEQDRLRQETDRLHIERLERLFKLMMRIGDRERKDLRERINALIDAHLRNEAKIAQLAEAQAQFQQKSDERMTRLEEAQAQFQQKSDERMTRLEETQTQVGDLLRQLTEATALAHRRLDALESNGTK